MYVISWHWSVAVVPDQFLDARGIYLREAKSSIRALYRAFWINDTFICIKMRVIFARFLLRSRVSFKIQGKQPLYLGYFDTGFLWESDSNEGNV